MKEREKKHYRNWEKKYTEKNVDNLDDREESRELTKLKEEEIEENDEAKWMNEKKTKENITRKNKWKRHNQDKREESRGLTKLNEEKVQKKIDKLYKR